MCDVDVVTAKRFVGTREGAELLGVSRSTLSRWVRDGHVVPAQRVGTTGRYQDGAMLFDADELERHPMRRRPPAPKAVG